MRTGAFILVIPVILTQIAFARPTYTGYSGAPGRGTCAGTCHGSSGGTVTVSGFPQTYVPNQQYLITIRKLSGSSIRNFNASCRVGAGSVNAGVLAAGTGTSTYNTSGETNGIHLSTSSRDSATFLWTAPVSGTGAVTLYVASQQGGYSGPNTVIAQTAGEQQAQLPAQASNPLPADGEIDVPGNVLLVWDAGEGAASHDVYFGTANPPDYIGNQTSLSYDPTGDLIPDTVYYWRIDERNDAGATEGTLWSFRTAAPNASPEQVSLPSELKLGPVYPNPFNATMTVSFAVPQADNVSVVLFDLLGRQVAELASGHFAAGTHRLQWSAQNVGTGIYFLRLQSGAQTLTMKVVALK